MTNNPISQDARDLLAKFVDGRFPAYAIPTHDAERAIQSALDQRDAARDEHRFALGLMDQVLEQRDALKAQLEEAVGALEPFARDIDAFKRMSDIQHLRIYGEGMGWRTAQAVALTFGDLRRAASIIQKHREG